MQAPDQFNTPQTQIRPFLHFLWLLFGISLILLIFALALVEFLHGWNNLITQIMLSVAASYTLALGVGLGLCYRGRFSAAMWLVLLASAGTTLAAVMFVTGLGVVTTFFMLIILASLMAQIRFAPQLVQRLVTVGLIVCLALPVLDAFGSPLRQTPSHFYRSFFLLLSLVGALIVLWLGIKQFVHLPLRMQFSASFIFITTLALAVPAISSDYIIRQNLTRTVGQNLQNLAQTKAVYVGEFLSHPLGALQKLAENPTVVGLLLRSNAAYAAQPELERHVQQQALAWETAADDAPLVQAVLANLAVVEMREVDLSTNFANLLLTNRYGVVVAALQRPAYFSYRTAPWWQQVYQAPNHAWFIAPVNVADRVVLQIALPIYAEGEVIGLLQGERLLDDLASIITLSTLGETGRSEIYLPNGLELAAEDEKVHLEAIELASADLAQLLAQPANHKYIEAAYDEEARFISLAAISALETTPELQVIGELGWMVVVHQAQAEALEPVDAAVRFSLMGSVIALLLSIGIGLFIARWFSAPLVQLTQTTQRIVAGDLRQRAQIGERTDEIGQLADSFNAMAQAQADRIATEQLARTEAERLRAQETHLRAQEAQLRTEAEWLQAQEAQLRTELEALNINLEKLVVERTQALELAMHEAKAARGEAEAANTAKSAFLANMSHELRTPLTVILGYAEMLQEIFHENTRHLPKIERIYISANHLLGLINDILDFSKIEAGRLELVRETFAVAKLVEEIVAINQPLLTKNHNRFELQLGEALGQMHSDAARLRQILLNLLSNAAKFTDHGQVTLCVERQELANSSWLMFRISDTGIGMTAEQLGQVFQPFKQADASTSRKYSGTGLGLVISRRLSQLLGGAVTVWSQAGQGSTFTVRLPTHLPEAPPSTSGVLPPTLSLEQPSRVLIIDDDFMARKMLAHHLSLAGFVVETAANGPEGLQRAEQHPPDIITLDILMPEMDGWEVLRALKAHPTLHPIPVVLLTVVENQERGYTLGAADYVLKPIDPRQVVQVLAKYQPLAAQTPSHVLIIEDEPAVRALLSDVLTETGGWIVNTAANGQLGLQQLHRQSPDVIVLDLMMPEMDGFEFLEVLRQNPQWRLLPVVVVTAMALTSEQRQLLNRNVTRILQKTQFTHPPADLVKELRSALARQQRQPWVEATSI